jgi:CTP:molybdopterin cytidylyltransferase MocA
VQIGVVLAAGETELPAELDRLGVPQVDRIFNPAPERGMFSSIQCAVRWPGWRSGLSHWVISLGDQPHLRGDTLRGLVEFAVLHSDRICQPIRNGRPRHPVLLPKSAFVQLAESTVGTLKEFLEKYPSGRRFWAVDDPGLDLDLDTPADYARVQPEKSEDETGES